MDEIVSRGSGRSSASISFPLPWNGSFLEDLGGLENAPFGVSATC